jgi:hypothetical protein
VIVCERLETGARGGGADVRLGRDVHEGVRLDVAELVVAVRIVGLE